MLGGLRVRGLIGLQQLADRGEPLVAEPALLPPLLLELLEAAALSRGALPVDRLALLGQAERQAARGLVIALHEHEGGDVARHVRPPDDDLVGVELHELLLLDRVLELELDRRAPHQVVDPPRRHAAELRHLVQDVLGGDVTRDIPDLTGVRVDLVQLTLTEGDVGQPGPERGVGAAELARRQGLVLLGLRLSVVHL